MYFLTSFFLKSMSNKGKNDYNNAITLRKSTKNNYISSNSQQIFETPLVPSKLSIYPILAWEQNDGVLQVAKKLNNFSPFEKGWTKLNLTLPTFKPKID